jgi:hypothetical protein
MAGIGRCKGVMQQVSSACVSKEEPFLTLFPPEKELHYVTHN